MILCVSRLAGPRTPLNIGDAVFLAPLDGDLFEGFLLEPVPFMFNPEIEMEKYSSETVTILPVSLLR